MFAGIFGLNWFELAIIGVVAVLIFQARLPTATREMWRGARELETARRKRATRYSVLENALIAVLGIVAGLLLAYLLAYR